MTNENLIKARECDLLLSKDCRDEYVRTKCLNYGVSKKTANNFFKEELQQLISRKVKQDLAKIPVGCGKKPDGFILARCGNGTPLNLCPDCQEIKEIKGKHI